MCARRRSNFLCDRKSPKNASPTVRVPALRFGQPAVLARGACRRTHYALRAAFKQLRQVRWLKLGVSCGTPNRPARCAARHGHKGFGQAEIKHPQGPSLRSAPCANPPSPSGGRPRERAERSDGPYGCWAVQPLVYAPASGCLRGGTSASALMLR